MGLIVKLNDRIKSVNLRSDQQNLPNLKSIKIDWKRKTEPQRPVRQRQKIPDSYHQSHKKGKEKEWDWNSIRKNNGWKFSQYCKRQKATDLRNSVIPN